MKNKIDCVFVNPIKFRKILAAGKNDVRYTASIVFLLAKCHTRETNKTFM